MTYTHFVRYFLILFLGTLACGLAAPASTPAALVPVSAGVPAPTDPPSGLTVQQFRNARYQLGARDDHAVVQLTEGKYLQGSDATTLDYAQISLTNFVSIGDLTGDGINEAAAVFFENYGGSGSFAFLAIYTNVKGFPIFLSSIRIDDRPKINRLLIEHGEVFLDATIHGLNDPGCCPALPTTRRYALVKNHLQLMNYETAASDGAKRIIEIVSPANGAAANGSVQVKGTVTIAPFENNLSYFIYSEAGDELTHGSLIVSAQNLGAPATFDSTIPLKGIPTGKTIYLEIQDVNAADGSLFAMNAVELVVK